MQCTNDNAVAIQENFVHYIPNIEAIPFSDDEARSILGISKETCTHGIKRGLFDRSVELGYRFELKFRFFGFFDLFEYSLKRNIFSFLHDNEQQADELINGLIDELALIIDGEISYSDAPLRIIQVVEIVELFCNEYREQWIKYWIYDGEKFSARKCAYVAVQIWCDIFVQSIKVLGLCPKVDEVQG